MRIEITGEGFAKRAEIKLGRDGIQVMSPQKAAQLAVWIEELLPDEVAEARKPKRIYTSLR